MAVSASTVVVGASYDDTRGADAGSAYIFDAATGDLLRTLNNPTVTGIDCFGWSVAVSGATVVVGAPFAFGHTGGLAAGSVYVFDAPCILLHDPNVQPQADSNFGSSVAADGNWTVVGVPFADVGGSENTGRAYVFHSTTGALVATLENPALGSGDYFGCSVAVSGSSVVVGAYGDDTGATDAGAAYVFDAATGTLLRTLNNPAPAQYDNFGNSVAVSGSTVVVGAYGSAYIFDAITGNLLRTLNNPAPAQRDGFGNSVAVSGSTVVVGAPYDDTGATSAGSAYVFDTASGNLLRTLNNPTPADYDSFGYSVAVSGSTVVVGTPDDDTGAWNAGSAYIFDVTTGNLLRTLNNPTPTSAQLELFGDSVAVSGSTVVVGAPHDDTGASSAGSAYVFDAATGSLLRTLNNPTPAGYDLFGQSVAVSGNTVVVGAPRDDTGATYAGSAYVFDAATGNLLRALDNPSSEVDDQFGASVALSGSTLVVGAPMSAGGRYAGHAYIIDATTGNLLRTLAPGGDTFGGEAFGHSVGVWGSSLVVGTPYSDFLDSEHGIFILDRGSAFAFDATTGNLLRTLNNPTPEDSDHFGFSVGVTESRVVVGAPGDDAGATDAGSVYLFDAVTGSLLRTLNNPTPAAGDNFGYSLAVSGTTLVVGTPYDDTGADNAGSAYIFDAATGNLLRTLNNPTPVASDRFGSSVALSGSTVVVGAPYDDTGAADSGSAYIFDAARGSLLRTLNNPTPAILDYFGYSVAVSGTTVVVGASGDGSRSTDSGAAYVFDAATGNLLGTLNNPTAAAGDSFGSSVAVSGNRAVVGAPYEDGISYDRGAAYVFDAIRAPASVDLLAASDTGISSIDDLTRLDNSASANALRFDVTGTIPGATVTVYADGTPIGTTTATGPTTTVTTDGTHDLADGTHRIAARQTEPGSHETGDSPGLTITVDTVAPLPDIVDVTPDPRTTAVSTITIAFNEWVNGFDKADLTLTRNGAAVSLATATLATSDNITFTLGSLTGLTGTAGTYVLTLTAAGSGITDLAGSPITASASDTWLVSLTNPTSFTGTAGDDLFEFIAASPSANPLFHQMKVTLAGSPTVTYLYDAAGSVSLTLRGGLGNDTLSVTGGPGTDTSNVYRYAILHTGPGTAGTAGYYSVYAPLADGSMETIVVDGGGGTGEKATLHNGPAAGDRFTALSYARTGSMVGTGTGNVYNESVSNFDLIYALANGGGTNATADLTDSYGNDLFVSKPEGAAGYSIMQHVGGDSRPCAYLFAGVGFSTIYGRSTRGGTDEAVLNGSSGDDTVLLQPQLRRAFLMKAGGGQTTYAVDFKPQPLQYGFWIDT